MPGGMLIGPEVCNTLNYGIVSGTQGTLVNASASANTKGSWVQITAATTADCNLFSFSTLVNASNRNFSVDIGVGAAGSEKVIINDMLFSENSNNDNGLIYQFPIHIPSGTAISARSQVSDTSATGVRVNFDLSDGAWTQMEGPAGVDTIGYSTTTTKGTSITAGANSAKGAYAVLSSSTSRDYMGIVIAFDFLVLGAPSDRTLWDVAVGAAGSEKIIIADYFTVPGGGYWQPMTTAFYPVFIPSGTAVSARAQTNNVATQTRGMVLYGVYQ